MITISLNSTKIQLKLDQLIQGVKDFSVPFDKAGTDLVEFFGGPVFESQGEQSGVAWRELSLATLYMRENRQGYYKNPPIETDMILVWTGRLKGGFFKEVEPMQLVIGNDVEYFKYHQMSDRKMLTINKFVVTDVTAQIKEYLNSLI